MNTTKIVGRAIFVEGDIEIERGFSFDDVDGFARYIQANRDIDRIEFIR